MALFSDRLAWDKRAGISSCNDLEMLIFSKPAINIYSQDRERQGMREKAEVTYKAALSMQSVMSFPSSSSTSHFVFPTDVSKTD